VAFSPDGQFLAGGGMKGEVCLWVIPSGQEIFRMKAHDKWIDSIHFSVDGQFLITSESRSNENARVWNVQTGDRVRALEAAAKLPIPFENPEFNDWRLPQRGAREQETAAVSADGRIAIWFPAHLWKIASSPNAPLWAAPVVDQSYLSILSLETAE
jgi:WD40 repeat protein